MLQRWLQHPCPASWRETGDVGSKTVRKTSCISHVHVFLIVFFWMDMRRVTPRLPDIAKKNIPFFRSPKEISPAVPMECAEHPIATPRTKGEDLAEHISTNQEGYRVSERCFRQVILLTCGINTHHPSWDVLLTLVQIQLERCHMAHCNHAMSHARKTGKAFKRLLPKEAPIHLGEMGS